MASGVTLGMIAVSHMFKYHRPQPLEQQPRDRSLRGKARVKARKAARR